jgi:malonyl-CoA O-methyltransferase
VKAHVRALSADVRRRTAPRVAGTPTERALAWVHASESDLGGIRVHAGFPDAYPEVSGYLVPTLLDYGERALAFRVLDWLLAVQRSDGGYTSAYGKPFVFDTAQVLRGLLAARGHEAAARRAASFLFTALEAGDGPFPRQYDGEIPENVLLYALPPLAAAGEAFGEKRWVEAAHHAADTYVSGSALDEGELTHFLAYALEGLIDLGRAEAARPVLEALQHQQSEDGGVRGRGGVEWVCSPGLAQLALCWLKTGRRDPARRAIGWLRAHQGRTGGLLGSYGPGASYFANEEIAWSVKFFLDAERLLSATGDAPPPDAALVREVQTEAGDAVLALPQPGIAATRLDADDDRFAGVASDGAIVASGNRSAAVRELARVLIPGGLLVAREPADDDLREELGRHFDAVTSTADSEGRMRWRARKRTRLGGDEWNQVIMAASADVIVEQVVHNRLTEWTRAIVNATSPGDRVLEIGSGTGQMSLHLAVAGRLVTALDVNRDNLTFFEECAARLGVEIATIEADATAALPVEDDSFECVWHSGLLEHFTREERRRMLEDWARVATRRVISLVPNGSSVAYRAGKTTRERAGTWPYGIERTLTSLRDDFDAAGIDVEEERSIGVAHALTFLPEAHPLRKALEAWIRREPEDALGANQGYLLLTVGRPRV